MEIWTVGHSTLSLDDFINLLDGFEIERLADVRTVPKSLRHPHFHTAELARSLPGHGIEYRHLARLGGWRRTSPESPNTGWRNKSFRGYADYAMTDEFARGLCELRELATERRTAMMCSEALWWRCHRRLISDRLVLEGDVVSHIGSHGRVSRHELTPFATVEAGTRIVYPGES